MCLVLHKICKTFRFFPKLRDKIADFISGKLNLILQDEVKDIQSLVNSHNYEFHCSLKMGQRNLELMMIISCGGNPSISEFLCLEIRLSDQRF